jgi:two-component system OmpR family sensor kinase
MRTQLLLFIGATLVAVCAAMALTTVFVQRAYLLGDLDDRVTSAAERSLGGAQLHPEFTDDLGFLDENGHPAGLLAARPNGDGDILSAEVVSQDAAPWNLTDAQRAALTGIAADGRKHTRTVPGLGTYRITVLDSDSDGVRVLTGLPMDDVQDMISGLVVVESVVAAAGLTVAGCVCAVVVRRQLRPLGRVAATAAEISRAPLDRGEVTALTRVPAQDTPARPARSAPRSTA